MTTIKLNAGASLAFDGKIIEYFYGAASRRTHVGTLHDVQLETDRKGKHWLHINANLQPGENIPGSQLLVIEDKVFGQVSQMVLEIQQAISSSGAGND